MPKPAKSQFDKFKQAARALETDDDEERFDKKLKRVAKAKLENEGDKEPDR